MNEDLGIWTDQRVYLAQHNALKEERIEELEAALRRIRDLTEDMPIARWEVHSIAVAALHEREQ